MTDQVQFKKIGEILVEKGIITLIQLNEALNEQDSHAWSDEKIGETLVRLGCTTRDHIYDALVIQDSKKEPDLIYMDVFSGPPCHKVSEICPLDPSEDQDQDLDPRLTTKKYVELPKYKSPTVTVGIESVYGLYNARGGLLDGVGLFRQDNETDEALAERASQAVKKLLLAALEENKEYRKQFEKPDSILPNIDISKIIDDFLAADVEHESNNHDNES